LRKKIGAGDLVEIKVKNSGFSGKKGIVVDSSLHSSSSGDLEDYVSQESYHVLVAGILIWFQDFEIDVLCEEYL